MKKDRASDGAGPADIVKRCEAWLEDQLNLDETGVAANNARLRGWAQKGEWMRAGISQGQVWTPVDARRSFSDE